MFSRPIPWFRCLAAVFAGVALTALAGSARGDILYIGDKGNDPPGSFEGSIEVTNSKTDPTTAAVITVTLKNTSPSAYGGYITGFAFNDPNVSNAKKGPDITSIKTFSTTYVPDTAQQFGVIGSPTTLDTINGSPYGDFDIGAAVGTDFEGTGTVQDGLAVGEKGTFIFEVTGTGLNFLTADLLMKTLSSTGPGMGQTPAPFVVRFRGFENGTPGGTSDKDVAGIVTPPPITGVPAPPGLVLAGAGFGCILLGRLRTRRAKVQA